VAIGVVLGIITNATGIVNSAQNYLDVMLYSLAPWTAINLVDYYLIHRGNYSVPDLFDRKGIYKVVNWRGVIIYLFSVGIEFLFMNSAVFVGPVSHALGGADIAWIVSLIVAGGLWYLTRPRSQSAHAEPAASAAGAGSVS
jgi:nucleobase:cation symporter-1, NCS1 family